MPKNPIANHARATRGNALPVLPCLVPRASERSLPLKHLQQWMTAAVLDRCAGPPRTARIAGAKAVTGQQNFVYNCSARLHACPIRPSAMLASPARLASGLPRPLSSRSWASSRRHETRFYSTSEDDYLVDEDEEKDILGENTSEELPLEDLPFYSLMNADSRELYRLALLIESQGATPTGATEMLHKKASALPPLDELTQQDIWWIKSFAQLNAIHDARLPKELRTSQLEVNGLTEQAVKKLLSLGRDAESIKDAWISGIRNDYSPEGKRNIWCEIMLWLLVHDQDAVLPALHATCRGRKAPDYVVADILEHFMSNHLQRRVEGDQLRLPPDFLATFARILEQKPFLGHALSQKFVHTTFAHCSLEQGTTFWNLLQTARFRASWHTYCHIAYFFGKHGEYVKALEVLRMPVELGALPTHSAFLATCAQILRSSVAKADAYEATAKILSDFVSMGVSFNIYLYTVTIHNAVDHGDLDSALAVYRLMQRNGVEPNDYTYTVLLKGLKDNAAPELLEAVLRDAEQSLPRLERPRVVATDIVHCIYLQHFEPAGTESAFVDLARIFCGYFNPTALVKLGVPARFFYHAQTADGTGMAATPAAICILLTAYLKLVSQRDPDEVVRLYRVFYSQIHHSGDHGLASLGQADYFYNAFLLALGQNASTLPVVSEVLWQMSNPRHHDKPLTSKYTWDILVNAFMRHGQPEAAERVLAIMAKHDQEPNDVTWNSFVRWYARRKNVERVLETIRRMQLQRMELSAMSLRALGRMEERDKLTRGLRQLDAQQQEQVVDRDQDYLVPDDYQEEPSIWENIDENGEQVIGKPIDGGEPRNS